MFSSDGYDMTRRPTDFVDRDGAVIHIGDVVEFYAGEPYLFAGYALYDSEPGQHNLTLMRDVVLEKDGVIYFVCGYGGCRAEKAAHVCKVIGRDMALVDTSHRMAPASQHPAPDDAPKVEAE